jgi:hypothetical protein
MGEQPFVPMFVGPISRSIPLVCPWLLLGVEDVHESLKRSSNTVGLFIEIARNQA